LEGAVSVAIALGFGNSIKQLAPTWAGFRIAAMPISSSSNPPPLVQENRPQIYLQDLCSTLIYTYLIAIANPIWKSSLYYLISTEEITPIPSKLMNICRAIAILCNAIALP
jgi:hypothetical protein